MRKYHFFIPVADEHQNLSVIHWSDTLQDFQNIVQHKREVENILHEDRSVRVLDIETTQAADIYLSSLLRAHDDADIVWHF